MMLYSNDTGILYSVLLANTKNGSVCTKDGEDYIESFESSSFKDKGTEYNMECYISTEAEINDLMDRWAKRCREDKSMPENVELSCSAYMQAVGMDAPVWCVVMPSLS